MLLFILRLAVFQGHPFTSIIVKSLFNALRAKIVNTVKISIEIKWVDKTTVPTGDDVDVDVAAG